MRTLFTLTQFLNRLSEECIIIQQSYHERWNYVILMYGLADVMNLGISGDSTLALLRVNAVSQLNEQVNEGSDKDKGA